MITMCVLLWVLGVILLTGGEMEDQPIAGRFGWALCGFATDMTLRLLGAL